MAERRSVCFGSLRLENESGIAYGSPTHFAANVATRAAVLALERRGNRVMAIGSQCNSTSAGKVYIKVANDNAAADWALVTVTAAD